jgi:type I restriction enzyme R subunit
VAADPDESLAEARRVTGLPDPSAAQIHEAQRALADKAALSIVANPSLRKRILELKQAAEQTIDTVSRDEVLRSGYSPAATDAARAIVTSFEQFIAKHKDEIAALQILYSRRYAKRPTLEQIKELADAIQRPPRQWTPDLLWAAYEKLDKSKVRGSGQRVLADLVSLVRFATRQDAKLVPYADEVQERFDAWMQQQRNRGREFTAEQNRWLVMIRDQIASSLEIRPDDFDFVPFSQQGGLAKASAVFGADFDRLIKDLNRTISA